MQLFQCFPCGLCPEEKEKQPARCHLSGVTDIETIMTYGVAVTPVVVVDGKVMCEGRVPEYSEICEWIGKQGSS